MAVMDGIGYRGCLFCFSFFPNVVSHVFYFYWEEHETSRLEMPAGPGVLF